MAASLGALVVHLGLDAAEFIDGLNKSQYQLKKFGDSVNDAVSTAKKALAGIAIALTANAFTELIHDAIKAQAALADLGARAGLTGSQLSSFTRAAALSNTQLEDVVAMSSRLSKSLIEGADATSKSAAVLRALGVSAKQVSDALANPAQGILILSKAINQLPEGGTKAAAQLLILGRSGGATSAFLRELADTQELVASKTDAQVAAAKKFEDSLTLISLNSSALKTSVANSLLPTLQDLADAFIKSTTGANTLKAQVDKLAASGAITKFAQDVAALAAANAADGIIDFVKSLVLMYDTIKTGSVQLLALGQQLVGVGKLAGGNLTGFQDVAQGYNIMKEAGKDWVTQLDAIVHRTTIADAVQKQFSLRALNERDTAEGAGPRSVVDNDAAAKAAAAGAARAKAVQDALNKAAKAGNIDDPSRKILEAALAALKANTEQEQAVLRNRNQYLESQYEQGNVSIADFYAAKQAAQDEDLRRTSQNYLDEIAEIDNFIAHAATLKDKAQGEKEKVASTARQNLAVIQAAGQSQQILDQQIRAAREYSNTLAEINARLLEMQGNTAAAASIRFDTQNETLRSGLRATVESPTSTPEAVGNARGTLDRLDAIRKLTVAQAQYNDVAIETNRITDRLGIAQAYVDLQQQTGSIGELSALSQKSELVRNYIGLLSAQVEAQKAVAEASKDPGLILAAQKAELALKQLAATSDQVKQKIDGIFTDNLTTFLDDIVDHTKTTKQAFLDMASGIERSITHLVNEDLAKKLYKSLFGEEGSTGGFSPGSFFQNILGFGQKSSSTVSGNTTPTGAAATAASLSALGLAADTSAAAFTASNTGLVGFDGGIGLATSSLAAFSAALEAAAAASASSGEGGLGSLFGSSGAGGLTPISGGNSAYTGPALGFYAKGGDPPPGQWSVVGEKGPELIRPRGAMTVISHNESKTLLQSLAPAMAAPSLRGILGFEKGGDPPVGHVSLVGEAGAELIGPRGSLPAVATNTLRTADRSSSIERSVERFTNTGSKYVNFMAPSVAAVKAATGSISSIVYGGGTTNNAWNFVSHVSPSVHSITHAAKGADAGWKEKIELLTTFTTARPALITPLSLQNTTNVPTINYGTRNSNIGARLSSYAYTMQNPAAIDSVPGSSSIINNRYSAAAIKSIGMPAKMLDGPSVKLSVAAPIISHVSWHPSESVANIMGDHTALTSIVNNSRNTSSALSNLLHNSSIHLPDLGRLSPTSKGFPVTGGKVGTEANVFLSPVAGSTTANSVSNSYASTYINHRAGLAAAEPPVYKIPQLSFSGFYAGGGDPPVGMAAVIGEEGPELFVPKTAGTIIPNSALQDKFSKGKTIQQKNTFMVNVPGNTSRPTAQQTALSTATEIRRALSKA